jgi:hypothetical protein
MAVHKFVNLQSPKRFIANVHGDSSGDGLNFPGRIPAESGRPSLSGVHRNDSLASLEQRSKSTEDEPYRASVAPSPAQCPSHTTHANPRRLSPLWDFMDAFPGFTSPGHQQPRPRTLTAIIASAKASSTSREYARIPQRDMPLPLNSSLRRPLLSIAGIGCGPATDRS